MKIVLSSTIFLEEPVKLSLQFERGCLKHLLSFDCFADGGFVCGFAVHLGAGRVEDDGRCPDRVELGVVLGLGVAEVLDLGHGELAHPDQARSIGEITYGKLEMGNM